MNHGEKLALIKERNFKTYSDFGKYVDVSSDWILGIVKKGTATMTDITNFIKISVKMKYPLDWLLIDRPNDDIVVIDDLRENDLLVKLNELQKLVDESEDVYFNDTLLSKESTRLASDGIKVLKQLINSGI